MAHINLLFGSESIFSVSLSPELSIYLCAKFIRARMIESSLILAYKACGLLSTQQGVYLYKIAKVVSHIMEYTFAAIHSFRVL